MKQRIVIEVCMADLKSRSKAMKIAVGLSGVVAAAITGPEKNQVEVVGESIDVVFLTKLIRKNVGYAEIVSVGEAKKEEAAAEKPAAVKPPEDAMPPVPIFWSFPPASYSYSDGYWNYDSSYDVRGRDPVCNIM